MVVKSGVSPSRSRLLIRSYSSLHSPPLSLGQSPTQGTKTIHRNKGATRHPRRCNGTNGNGKEEEGVISAFAGVKNLSMGRIPGYCVSRVGITHPVISGQQKSAQAFTKKMSYFVQFHPKFECVNKC
jgi:hypothetical protein